VISGSEASASSRSTETHSSSRLLEGSIDEAGAFSPCSEDGTLLTGYTAAVRTARLVIVTGTS